MKRFGIVPINALNLIKYFLQLSSKPGLETGLNVIRIKKVKTHAYLYAITMIAAMIAVNQENKRALVNISTRLSVGDDKIISNMKSNGLGYI